MAKMRRKRRYFGQKRDSCGRFSDQRYRERCEFRLTPEMLKTLVAQAEAAQMTVSDFVRTRLAETLEIA